jgi:hypothetical protein
MLYLYLYLQSLTPKETLRCVALCSARPDAYCTVSHGPAGPGVAKQNWQLAASRQGRARLQEVQAYSIPSSPSWRAVPRARLGVAMRFTRAPALLLVCCHLSHGLVGLPRPIQPSARASVVLSDAHWMDVLKFDGAPQFDVLERTKEYASKRSYDEMESYYAKDYVFRGSVIGPITNADVVATQKSFDVLGAYPDLDRGIFGFTIDPQNPYRCLFFERWTGTNTGDLNINGFPLKATGNRVETPLHMTSVVWNPDGQIVYQCISPPVDRFEGNTKGTGAVFGLLAGAGLGILATGNVGNPVFLGIQKLGAALGIGGKAWSEDEDLPAWWKSSARGADPTDL